MASVDISSVGLGRIPDCRAKRYPSPQRGKQNGPPEGGPFESRIGGDLLSQALSSQVPSARRGLTALFGMGRGVSPSQSHRKP